jgi:hypothetical protein
MDAALRTLLDDLHVRGTAHDEAEPDRLRRLRNLEPATAELLTLVVRIAGARTVVGLLFLDAERVEYPKWWPHPARVLKPRRGTGRRRHC